MEREFVERCRGKRGDFALEQVKGLEKAANSLKKWVLDPVLTSQFQQISSVLLYGPAGTGKTALTIALQASFPGPFLRIPIPELVSQSSFPLLQAVLAHCDSHSPCVLCLDELDMLDCAGTETKALLCEWIRRNKTVGIIGISAYPWRIEGNFRLERGIFVDLPSAKARKALFLQEAGLSDDEISVLVSRSAGLTGADLVVMRREAAMSALRECISTGFVLIRNSTLYPAAPRDPGALPLSAAQSSLSSCALRPLSLVLPTQNDYLRNPMHVSVTARELEQFRAFGAGYRNTQGGN